MADATQLRPPAQPSRDSLSTRSLQQLYRQSHGDAFFAGAFAHKQPQQPWLEPAAPPRVASWASDLSGAASEGAVPPLIRNGTSFRSETSSYRSATGYRASSMPQPKSTPSFDAMPESIGGLDLTDPWGFAFRSASPYDVVLSAMPRHAGPGSPARSTSRMSVSSASSGPSHVWPAPDAASAGPVALYTVPTSASAPVPEDRATMSAPGTAPEQHDGPTPAFYAPAREPRKAASTSDLAGALAKPAVGRSKLQQVRNNEHEEELLDAAGTSRQRKFKLWKPFSNSKEKAPAAPPSLPPKALQPTRSKLVEPALPSPSAFNKPKGARLPPASHSPDHLSTPALSESASSSAASSSIDTNEDTVASSATSLSPDSPPLKPTALPEALEKSAALPGSAISIRAVTPGQVSPRRPSFVVQEPLTASVASTHTVLPSHTPPPPPPQQPQQQQRLASAAPIYDQRRTRTSSIQPNSFVLPSSLSDLEARLAAAPASLPPQAPPVVEEPASAAADKKGAGGATKRRISLFALKPKKPASPTPASPPLTNSNAPEQQRVATPPAAVPKADTVRYSQVPSPPLPAIPSFASRLSSSPRSSVVGVGSAADAPATATAQAAQAQVEGRRVSSQFRRLPEPLPSPMTSPVPFSPLPSPPTVSAPLHSPMSGKHLPQGARASRASDGSTFSWPGSIASGPHAN